MICLKISTFVVSTTTCQYIFYWALVLWFAWKYLPLWYQQQPSLANSSNLLCCDLLENIYLCGINNNFLSKKFHSHRVVICLKISTFVVSTTTLLPLQWQLLQLWFAWKYLPLWYQQQLQWLPEPTPASCDLLENIYLCGINNNNAESIG